LSILKKQDEIKFKIYIIAANYHSCRIEGVAKKITDHYSYTEEVERYFLGKKEKSKCILEFHTEGDEIYLLDTNFICRDKYCGARAGFNGERFYKK